MPKTVMIVDDDLDILSILTFAFESRGYRVRKAQDGQEALQIVLKFVPDIFLLDINMPGIDGLELCRRLRAQARTRNIPIMFLTGRDQPDVVVQGFQAGGDDYVVKPFNMQELAARVENLLRRNQAGTLAKQSKEGAVIAVTSARGGVGKTTLAVNLGIALARMWTEQVVLIDASLEFGHSSVLLDLSQPRDLTALLQEQSEDVERDYLEETYLTPHPSGLHYLAAPPSPGDVESIGPAEVEHLLHLLKPAYGYVVVDLAPSIREPYRSFLRLADQVVVVVNPEVLTLVATQSMLQALAMLEVPAETIQLVLNDFPRAANSPSRAEIEGFLGLPLASTIPAEPLRAPEAFNAGRPLVLDSADDPFGQSIVKAAYYLSSTLAGHQ
jgi:pilus assembly protein CpaE